MIEGGRQATCPQCGGPIEFKLGASAALVCPWCRFAVVRSDRDLRAIGKVADLVPTAPSLAVGDLGNVEGRPFTVAGRLQLDHGKGPWDEWFVGFEDGTWGWVAQAQGKVLLTQPTEATGLPRWEQMRPGHSGTLPGSDVTWTVAERGESTLLSGEGELPFPSVTGQRGRYVDLQGEGGAFATIDYGDPAGGEAPRFFVGRELPRSALRFEPGGAGPRPVERVEVQRLRCPNCGGPVPILRPAETERAGCESCGALLDYEQGALALLRQLDRPAVQPEIPLGAEGTLRGQKLLCIGFMERSTDVDGVRYAWREYLLHGDDGYRWLVEDNGNWVFVRPVGAGEVRGEGGRAVFEGRAHKLFASNLVTVRFVLGEFYWKVEVGEESHATDFVAPPSILSEERSATEVVWSAGTWVAPREVWRAFALPGEPPKPTDVSPAQPNPARVAYPTAVALVFMALLAVVAVVARPSGPRATLVEGAVPVPPAPDPQYQRAAAGDPPVRGLGALVGGKGAAVAGAAASPSFTPAFTVPPGTKNLRITLRSDLGHGWLGVAVALVDQDTGELIELTVEEDRYYDAGDARAPAHDLVAYVGDPPPGTYRMRLDPHWARRPGAPGETEPPTLAVAVATDPGAGDVFCPCACAGVLLWLPALFAYARRATFEQRRWSLSNAR